MYQDYYGRLKPVPMRDYFNDERLRQIENFSNNYYFYKKINSGKINIKKPNKQLFYFSSKRSSCFGVSKQDFMCSRFVNKMEIEKYYYVRAHNKYNGRIIGFVYCVYLHSTGKIELWFLNKFYKEIIAPRGIVQRKPFKYKKNYIERTIKRKKRLKKSRK